MTQTLFRQYRWFAALAAFPTLLILGGAAKAAPDEQPDAPAEPTTPQSPQAEVPTTGTVAPVAQAPAMQTPESYVEHVGPETFPGRLRGLYGGSLWLEPSFHGLQWPQNTRTGLGVSGSFWVDSGYEAIKRDLPSMVDSHMYFQQGRGVLRVTPAYVRGRFFIQGQAELVGNLCQTASATNNVCAASGTFTTDDLWIRVGEWNRWDLKLGRFEAWEGYHLGMGMEPSTFERLGAGMFGVENPASPKLEVPTLYAVNYLHDRPTDGLAVGYAAFHVYPTDYLRFELLAKLGADEYQKFSATGSTASTYYGGRFTPIFDIGWFKLKVGLEYQRIKPVMQDPDMSGQSIQKKDAVEERVQYGAGGSLQFVVDPILEFGLNAAWGHQSYTDSTGGVFAQPDTVAQSYTTKSVGGFANLRVADQWLVGLGANRTERTDEYRTDPNSTYDYVSQWQGFLAVQYLLAGQLYIKAVVGYAQAQFQASDVKVPVWDNYMYSGRIRLMYLY